MKKLNLLDIAIIIAILSLASFLVYRMTYSLNYKWDWSLIPGYILHYDESDGSWQSGVLLQGFFTTIKLSIWGTLLASLVGILMGLLSISRKLFLRMSAKTYVELVRNIPALVIVFIYYFFISDQIMPYLHIDGFARSLEGTSEDLFTFFLSPPERITQFISGAITLGLFQGAYISEIVRAGIQSIERGQWEASAAIGLTRWQQMRRVILPQAVRNMLPPLANEFINTIKYSSIVSVISIQELTFQGMQVMASTQVNYEVWLTVTGMYLVLCLGLSVMVGRLEVKLARNRH